MRQPFLYFLLTNQYKSHKLMLIEQRQRYLLQLGFAKQNSQLQQIKKRFGDFSKYFFNIRQNITIAYDKNIVYVIHKEYLKLIDLGRPYVITDLTYNYEKNIVAFLTVQGQFFLHFASSKTQISIKKDFKKVFLIDWMYSSPQVANIFIAEEGGIHLYRLEDEKKNIKEVKHISGKYHCFLYEPISEFLIGLPNGECDVANIFQFENQKAKNWFKCGEIQVNFKGDQVIEERIKRTKSIGLESSRINKEIFSKKNVNEDYFIDVLRINGTPYLSFYFSGEGKLQLTPMVQFSDKKIITIKIPSDSLPSFNVVDNMLVVHLKNQRITFVYDINSNNFQVLVSPYPLVHEQNSITQKIYSGDFLGKRILLPGGWICKWKINLEIIYHFLKNQMQIFQFLNRRRESKMIILKWMRENLFAFKPLNISKMWKSIFMKNDKGSHDESETVSIIELYSNLFYTLSIEPLISKEALTNILIECLRQALEFRIKIPDLLQLLMTELLLETGRYEILTYLCHHDVIKADQKIYKIIYEKGEKTKDDLLVTLSIDLASQTGSCKQILRLLMKLQRTREGKRFVKANYDKMEVLDMLEMSKYVTAIDKKRQFVKFLKFFIAQKYPAMNTLYLDEAEQKLFS